MFSLPFFNFAVVWPTLIQFGSFYSGSSARLVRAVLERSYEDPLWVMRGMRVYAARLSAVTMGPICNFYHSRKSRFRHARQEPTIAMFYFVCYFFFTITASAVGGDPARGLGTLAHSGEDSLRNSASDAGAVDSDKWKVQ